MRKAFGGRKLIAALIVFTFHFSLFTDFANAAAPSLKVTPLKYQEIIPADKAKLGFIDVANPSDGAVRIVSQVQAFRQINLEGDLEFYDNELIASAIRVSTTDFELGPREAARIGFTIDSPKLPKGGVYAAIFFRTVPPEEAAAVTHISTSAKVGTLLILNVGGEIKPEGKIKNVQAPWWNFGTGLSGTIEYTNTASLKEAIAFNPNLQVKAGPWGKPAGVEGPLVMPGNTRHFTFEKPGNYLGLIPLVLSDSTSGQSRTVWVLAVTGFWRVAILALLALIMLDIYRRLRERRG